MERNEAIPTAAERVAGSLPVLRAYFGDHQALAAAMTALGVPTNASTLSRIETGKQAANIDELLLLSILGGGDNGLRAILRTPFRIGDVVIRTADDMDAITGGARTAVGTDVFAEAFDVARDFQDRQFAMVLDVDPAKIAEAARDLYGHRMSDEITRRANARAEDVAVPGSAKWQAYRSHAVRAVRAEITDHVAGQTGGK